MVFRAKSLEIMYKIFCIGQNKTGTTSLMGALSMLGYEVCPEDIMYNIGSTHFQNFKEGDYEELFGLVDEYDVFEDRPWNHTNFYETLHSKYNDAKFILTTRDVDQWWDSYIRWDKKVNLRHTWHYRLNSEVCYGVESFMDNPELSKETYIDRNNNIRNYFKDNPNFLELDINEDNKLEKLCMFLNKDIPNELYPHLNQNNIQ